MILNKSQAEAIYTAICAMNNVFGTATYSVEGVTVVAQKDGRVTVDRPFNYGMAIERECYYSQSVFAAAYDLS